MTNKPETRLSLEASKAIHDLGVVVESRDYWLQNHITKEWLLMSKERIYEIGDRLTAVNRTPALNFQETLTALREIGRKMKWEDCRCEKCRSVFPEYHNGCVRCGNSIRSDPYFTYHAHRLTDSFLQGGMEKVSEEVLKLLN